MTMRSRGASIRQAVRAVFWSFFGVRKRRDLEADAHLNPVHVIVVALCMAVLFVLLLVGVVHWVAR